ncbi:helix-turn-helix domain-containing protein [Sphingomonas sp. Leaf62]|uniref:helix-turn-helix domain-containing protein n=1 Tax=Sphingomonas sp. Leaf62 TaxID=1736228 RepID=UPI0006FF6BAD|nr:helix-turn-helix domain-containing protein [Sphingomonas sp. Leaf62]KQN77864.1 hypothetical protein ASE91_14185 [Sphingomonas sp. Leaf62]
MLPFIVAHLIETGNALRVVGSTRKMDAFIFVVGELVTSGRSPSLEEIARHLGVAKSRARQLISLLRQEGAVQQTPGAQRALTVPGLERYIAIQRLRGYGFTVDEDIMRISPSTLVQLPIVAVIEHRRADDSSQPSA